MTVRQTIIPQKVIKMAKAIQHADQNKQQILIVQSRATGKTWAYRIAREHNN